MLELDWLGALRRAVDAMARLFADEPTIAGRTVFEGVGEGGDHSLALDRRCEDIVFAELERLHAETGTGFVAISEERGEVAFGDPASSPRVVIDPIDGSLNTRRAIPAFALSVAVASGPSMADVELGYVYDFGADEEFVARRGQGAEVNGRELVATGPGHGLEVVGLESADPAKIAPIVGALVDRVYRIRVIGSIAITLSYVGGGRLDGMLSARCRSVDAAAAQLIAREAGAQVAFGELPLDAVSLSLDARYPLAGALDAEMLSTLLEAQAQTSEA